MRKWLRSWFAWRFSLRRLAVAVVFLGAFVGLNMRKIGPLLLSFGNDPTLPMPAIVYGWPLPLKMKLTEEFLKLSVDAFPSFAAKKKSEDDWAAIYRFAEVMDASIAEAQRYQLPMTHQTYRLLGKREWQRWLVANNVLIDGAVVNPLFALTVLALILFLQIPRRKEPSPPPARAGG